MYKLPQMIKRVTPSKLALARKCTHWTKPDVQWVNTSSPAAQRGTKIHAHIARYVDTGALEIVEEDIAYEYTKAVTIVDRLIEQGWHLRAEVALAWSHITDDGRELYTTNRDYSQIDDYEVPGTADILGRNGNQTLIVEWKSGSIQNAEAQLEALALLAGRAHQADIEEGATVTVIGVSLSPKLNEPAYKRTFSAWELAAIAADLHEFFGKEPQDPSPGEHCTELYCPAKQSCPAIARAVSGVAELIPADKLVRREDFSIAGPIESPDHAAHLLTMIRLVSAWCDERKDELKALCPPDGWKLSDGRTMKETRSMSTKFDQDRAVALLKALGATNEQLESISYKFEKSNGLRVYGGKKERAT